MDILGVGPLELLFILLIALIVFGPNDMVKAGMTLGRLLRKVVTSPSWKTIQQTSNQIRTLPNKMIREAGLEDFEKQLPRTEDIEKHLKLDEVGDQVNEVGNDISEWLSPPQTIEPPEMGFLSSNDVETADENNQTRINIETNKTDQTQNEPENSEEDHPTQSMDPITD